MSIYGFRDGPSYGAGLTPATFWRGALEQPMSFTGTIADQAAGQFLVNNWGTGTIARDITTPAGVDDREGAVLKEAGRLNPLLGLYGAIRGAVQSAINTDQKPMSESMWKTSPYYRDGIPYDARMTEDRAASLAMQYDRRKVREFYASKQPLAAFIGQLAGQAVDPINYIPIAGPEVQAAAVAKAGVIGGHIATASVDAALNTGITAALTAPARAQYGDDVSWQGIVSDMATAALAGAVFGGIGGAVARRAGNRAAADALKEKVRRDFERVRDTQRARAVLNEAIDGLANDGEVRISPAGADIVQRTAEERAAVSRAYDLVNENPTGPVRDPLVAISPEDIDGTILARGAFRDINQVDLNSRRGWGLVKIIWDHGERSAEPQEFRVTKADVVDLPNVVRDFEPSSVSADGARREWRVERDGRTVVYADAVMDDGRHVVTAYVQRPDRAGSDALMSTKREKPVAVESSSDVGSALGDTGRGLNSRTPGDRPQPAGINISPAASDRNPQVAEAAASVDKPEATARQTAESFRVDPETGDYLEAPELAQVGAEGRLTDEDRAVMENADKTVDHARAWADALKAAVGCLL